MDSHILLSVNQKTILHICNKNTCKMINNLLHHFTLVLHVSLILKSHVICNFVIFDLYTRTFAENNYLIFLVNLEISKSQIMFAGGFQVSLGRNSSVVARLGEVPLERGKHAQNSNEAGDQNGGVKRISFVGDDVWGGWTVFTILSSTENIRNVYLAL